MAAVASPSPAPAPAIPLIDKPFGAGEGPKDNVPEDDNDTAGGMTISDMQFLFLGMMIGAFFCLMF